MQRFLGAYTEPAPVFLFTLWAPLAAVERRERERKHRRGSALASPRAIWPWSSGSQELGEVTENVTAPAEVAAQIDRRSLPGGGRAPRRAWAS